jgi:ATP-dependent 26S proteasome regulatory subunit
MIAEYKTVAASTPWQEFNQHSLVREFAALRCRLEGKPPETDEWAIGATEAQETHQETAIDRLSAIFELSGFERDLLLLAAGVEMDSDLADRCAELTGRAGVSAQRGVVTFSLAISILSAPHWSALSASAPLRRFRLLTIEPDRGLTSAGLRIDERVLHYLAGANQLDPRLEGMLFPKAPPEWMDAEHFRLAAEELTNYDGRGEAPVFHLCGDDPLGQESVASMLAHRNGRGLLILRHEDTPAAGAEMEQFLHLWMRERLLLPAYLLLQWGNEQPSTQARQLAERAPGALIVASREPIRLHRAVQSHTVNKPSPAAQQRLWMNALHADQGVESSPVPAGFLGEVAEQFRLSAETIVSIAASAVRDDADSGDATKLANRIWTACRQFTHPRLEGLAEQIVPSAKWEDLILPDAQMQVLRQIAAQTRNRMTVYESWGFSARGRRGLGISALFAGPSGTGKTLAAEVLATDLRLDLFRIDLSAVVSKYIGETEKNLKQVFDAAESGGCLLLFDEADALFGKRAEVKDSHDRYANIEVGYLLQRMESFQGLAVLTTNLKSSMDKSFQRRLRFTIDFPFPDIAERRQIWERVFPPQTPTQDLDPSRLAALNMTGGNIRNIALNAAFLAAGAGQPVCMSHILQAAQLEAVKTERTISEMEVRRWV